MLSRNTIIMGAVLFSVTACGGASRQAPATGPENGQAVASSRSVSDHTVLNLQGEPVDLAAFRGHPMLIVNTASKCGYTPQYEGLQRLWETYGDRGLVVIGFPSNDFGNQEPGTADEIETFCRLNYGVTFPMMAKVHVKGADQAPVYRTLTVESADEFRGEIEWNFTKFLVDGDGRVVARFDSAVEPLSPQVTSAIEALLSQNRD